MLRNTARQARSHLFDRRVSGFDRFSAIVGLPAGQRARRVSDAGFG